MVAHVLPFFPEFAFAAEAIRGGALRQAAGGALQARHLAAGLVGRHRRRRQDRRPGRRSAHPRHALHRPGLRRAGQRLLVRACGKDGAVAYLTTQYLYGPGGPAVSCSSGAWRRRPAVRPRLRDLPGKGDAGLRIGHDAADGADADGQTEQPPRCAAAMATVAAFTAEIQAAVDGVAAGKEPDLLSGQAGARRPGRCATRNASRSAPAGLCW